MADNNAVSFARLFEDAVQITYKGLHALLDDLVDADSDVRRERLVDFSIEKRHLFARLLITVRWYMNFSAFHNSARSSYNLANSRSTVFVRDADSMHFVWSTLRGATTVAPALHEAAEVMGASVVFDRMPRSIIDSLGLDSHAVLHNIKPAPPSKPVAKKPPKPINVYADPSDPDASTEEDISQEAVERLGSLTRRIVSESLPTGISVVRYSTPPEGAAVRIGVPGAWTADVILSGLVLDDAKLRLLQFQILVDSHPDSQSPMRSQWRSDTRPIRMWFQERYALREMLDDRMGWSLNSAISNEQKEQRFAHALRTLATAMSTECAGNLVLAHTRAGLGVMLSRKRWLQAGLSATGRWTERGKKIPLQIFYWSKSHANASVRISIPSMKEESCGKIVEVEHDPAFPAGEQPLRIDFQRVDVQRIILDCARGRAQQELCMLQHLCTTKFNSTITSIVSDAQAAFSLVFSFLGHGVGLELSLSLTSGAAFISPKGALQLALSGTTSHSHRLRSLLWKGERFFKVGGTKALWNICEKILDEGLSLLQNSAAIRSMCAVGHGAITQWPPGIQSVEKPVKGSLERPVQPPFCTLDLKKPRCFLSLGNVSVGESDEMIQSERPPAKRRRVQFNFTESDGLYFFEGQLRDDHDGPPNALSEMHRSARALATWTELHQDMLLRLKRDKIVKMLAANKLMPELPREASVSVCGKVRVELKTLPLETEKSMLLVGEDDGWGMELTLTNDVFCNEPFNGYSSSYNVRTRVLRFYYPLVSKATVVNFGRDLMRARTAATLSLCLKEKAHGYNIVHRTPARMVVNVKGLRLSVGLGPSGMEIETWPKHHVFNTHLVPLMEELLMESRKKMGHSFAGLLTMAVPMGLALHMALPNDPSLYRLRFLTSLWVRIAVGGRRNGERVTHCIDVDVRGGVSKVYVSDYGKYLRQKASKGHKEANAAGQFAEMPKWEHFVKELTGRKEGKTVNAQGSTVEISMNLLGKFLSVLVKSV